MIRLAEVGDIWRKVDNNSYQYNIKSLNLNGILGINEDIEFKNGIFAICGLNGVGKSTIYTAIKDILGLKINDNDKNKLNNTSVSCVLKNGNKDIKISNIENNRLLDLIEGDMTLIDVDFNKLIELNNFFSQSNFHEFVDQYEENNFEDIDIEELSYLVGKTYDSVTLREIEVNDDFIVPYFQVSCNGLQYDSLKMGTGEHFLFYIYWIFKKVNTSGIILIEEPEVFISVNSQINLMNFIAKKMNNYKFSVVLVTHSPFILKNIPQDRMLILYHYLDKVEVNGEVTKEYILQDLGLTINKKGIFIFEDTLALEFFKSICRREAHHYLDYYSLEKVKGFAEISKILSTPKLKNMDYRIIGIYDGDMKDSKQINFSTLNSGYTFLPGDISVEKEFKKVVRDKFHLVLDKIGLNEKQFNILLSKVQGMEYHDWLQEVAKQSRKEFTTIVDSLYEIWYLENKYLVNKFLEELKVVVNA